MRRSSQCCRGLIVFDHLRLLTPARRQDNRQQEVSELSRDLEILAKDLNVPMIELSQLSREVEKRKPSIRVLSDLRDSGGIEQYADVILFIYRRASRGAAPAATAPVLSRTHTTAAAR